MELVKRPPDGRPSSPFHRVLGNLPPVLIFGFYFWLLLQSPITSRWLDFPVYWEAGAKAVQGFTAYDVPGHFQFKYSPLIALLFGKALSPMGFESASWFFQKLMLFLWLLLLLRFSKRNFRWVAIALLFFGNAIRLDLELGQVNALVLYLLALLFGSLERKATAWEDLAFAFIFSISIQLKLFCLILVPILLIQREWRKLALGLAFLPLLSIGGVAFTHGWDFAVNENIAWLRSLTESTDSLILSDQNVALLGISSRLLGVTLGKIVWALSGTVFLAYLIKNRGRPVEWFRNRLLFAISVFNPLVWSYWILFAMPVFFERLKEYSSPRSPVGRGVLAFGTAITFAAFNGQHAKWAWQGGIFAGLLFLGTYEVLSRSPWSFPSRSK